MILNPFQIVASRSGEDQVTFALGTVISAGGAALIASLMAALGAKLAHCAGDANVDIQCTGPTSRPDARIELGDGTTILFENKIVSGALLESQIRAHLDAFGSARPSAAKILLVITPDASPPTWWDSRSRSHPDVQFVFGSWHAVSGWARDRVNLNLDGEVTLFLLNALVRYLEEEVGIGMKKATFEPEMMALVACDSSKWISALESQHAAQEELFTEVGALLRPALGRGDDMWIKVDSRWGETWTPVSTFLEFWWPMPGMREMKDAHLWAEAFLDEKAHKIELRTGILFSGKAQVGAWHGVAKEIGAATFGDRYWDYRSGGAYAEVWASQPLDIARLDETKSALVADLVRWVTVVLPAMAKAQK